MNARNLIVASLSVFLAGCFADSPDGSNPNKVKDGATAEKQEPPDARPRLLEIAKEYKNYDLIDGKPRWAPLPCAPARPLEDVTGMPKARFSASSDEDTHGRKLYVLFAKQTWSTSADLGGKTPSYTAMPGGKAPIGQVIVKQSWQPEEVPAAEAKGSDLLNFAVKAGKHYRAGLPADLFVMYKLDPSTPGTHNGWVYGVVSPDGKTVKGAGRLENCMSCHMDAPHDRLFGLPKK